MSAGTVDGQPAKMKLLEALKMNDSRTLEIPQWVPAPVASLAQMLFAEAAVRPREVFGAHLDAIRRVASDERMHAVWTEIYRRKGGARRAGSYVHAARSEMLRFIPQFQGVESISPLSSERDRIQDQTAAVLFLIVTGNALWDRQDDAGPRTRTQAEIDQDMSTLQELASGHEKDAEIYQKLGHWRAAQILHALAADNRSRLSYINTDHRSPWIVMRNSTRVGDRWVRGFIIEITNFFLGVFGKKLCGTVAHLSNVALDRQDVTEGMVQGVVKHVR